MIEIRFVPQQDNAEQLNVVVAGRCKGVIVPTEAGHQYVRYDDGEVFHNASLDDLKAEIQGLYS